MTQTFDGLIHTNQSSTKRTARVNLLSCKSHLELQLLYIKIKCWSVLLVITLSSEVTLSEFAQYYNYFCYIIPVRMILFIIYYRSCTTAYVACLWGSLRTPKQYAMMSRV